MKEQLLPSSQIFHYMLEQISMNTFALNTELGTFVEFAADEMGIRLLREQQFTNAEVNILKPLLDDYPHFCPYEVLLASFNHGFQHVTDVQVARCRERLDDAQLMGMWDQEMRPVRNVLSRTRLKLDVFGMKITSILETGYALFPIQRPKTASQRSE